jgi:hypothetical protein
MDIADNPVPFLSPFQPSDLSACKILAIWFSAFCKALFHNTALEMFGCQHNPIRDEWVVAPVHIPNAWTAVRQLDLELSEIGDAGATTLFAAVEVSPTLH